MKKEDDQKAVILITIDALRSDSLKSYGYFRNTAPNIENFAKKGVVFLNTITNGPESPTAFSSIFTSILPLLDGGYSPLPPQKISLPQILKENGISTYSIHSNPNLGRYFNYNRGFDIFLDGERYKKQTGEKIKHRFSFYLNKILNYRNLFQKLIYRVKGFNLIKSWLRKKVPALTDVLLPFTPIAYNAPYVANKLNSFLKTIQKPFFIWAHFMDVHNPYNPPSQNILKFREKDFSISEREFLLKKVYPRVKDIKITPKMIKDLKTLYDSEINFIDESLTIFFNNLRTYIKNNCLVIITADHGESFYEHGLFGHQGSVYEEVLRVPLIIVELGKNLKKKTIQETVQLIDLTPTILDYFGIKIPENFQGLSLLSLIEGNSIKRKNIIISECYQKSGFMKRNKEEGYILLAIRNQGWKYIFDQENGSEFLFNLNLDPKEKINLADENPQKLSEFRIIKEYHLNKISQTFEEKQKMLDSISKFKSDKVK
ncbi:MAG: sulfatase [Candidatus Thorarchaeota archaeon]